jgi:hypothetical protein
MECGYPSISLHVLYKYTEDKSWCDAVPLACLSIVNYCNSNPIDNKPQPKQVEDPGHFDLVARREINKAIENKSGNPANWGIILDYSLEVIRSRAFNSPGVIQ